MDGWREGGREDVDGWMDVWMDGWMDGWMDELHGIWKNVSEWVTSAR
jgi:hypothetical protein